MQKERIEDLLPRRLKAARALAGLTVDEVSEQLGWTTWKVWRLERGEQVPDAVELASIARVLGQPVSYFIGEETAA